MMDSIPYTIKCLGRGLEGAFIKFAQPYARPSSQVFELQLSDALVGTRKPHSISSAFFTEVWEKVHLADCAKK